MLISELQNEGAKWLEKSNGDWMPNTQHNRAWMVALYGDQAIAVRDGVASMPIHSATRSRLSDNIASAMDQAREKGWSTE